MHKILFLCLALSALSLIETRPPNIPQGNEWWITGKSAILKSGNFDETVSKDRYTVVELILPNSEESKNAKDEWDKFAEMYMGPGKREDVNVAIINGWQFAAISAQYSVKTFPTVLFFAGGSTEYKAKYEGEMRADALRDWTEQNIATARAEAEATAAAAAVNTDSADAPPPATEDANAQATIVADDAGTNQEPPASQDNTQQTQEQQEVVNNGSEQQQEQQQNENQQQQQNEQQQQEQQQQQQNEQQQQQQQTPPPPQQQQQQTPPPPQQQQQRPPPPQQQQQRVENNNAAAADDSKREVKVVLNTTLLQSQFEALQQHLDAVTANLKTNINDNVRKIDELTQLLNAQRQDMNQVRQSLSGQAQKFDELKQVLTSNKQEVQNSVTGHTEKHLEEVKGALHQIKGKVFEQKTGESGGFGGGLMFLLLGGLVGGGVTFCLLSMSKNKQKRKLLID